MLSVDQIEAMFTQNDGQFRLARWERPIAPVVFGVDDATLAIVKGAIEAIVALANHQTAETDPEQGANCMVFFISDWRELLEVPDLDGLVPGISARVPELVAAKANQYRHFRFEENGAIRAAFVFLQMDEAMAQMAARDVALAQAAQLITLWGADAFSGSSPLARAGEAVVLRPEIGALIAAIYDKAMPSATTDAANALRLAARLGQAHGA